MATGNFDFSGGAQYYAYVRVGSADYARAAEFDAYDDTDLFDFERGEYPAYTLEFFIDGLTHMWDEHFFSYAEVEARMLEIAPPTDWYEVTDDDGGGDDDDDDDGGGGGDDDDDGGGGGDDDGDGDDGVTPTASTLSAWAEKEREERRRDKEAGIVAGKVYASENDLPPVVQGGGGHCVFYSAWSCGSGVVVRDIYTKELVRARVFTRRYEIYDGGEYSRRGEETAYVRY